MVSAGTADEDVVVIAVGAIMAAVEDVFVVAVGAVMAAYDAPISARSEASKGAYLKLGGS